jgi:hypothetical protein
MSETVGNDRDGSYEAALAHLEEALSILDDIDAPGEIGAQLDLVICRLRKVLEKDRPINKPRESS